HEREPLPRRLLAEDGLPGGDLPPEEEVRGEEGGEEHHLAADEHDDRPHPAVEPRRLDLVARIVRREALDRRCAAASADDRVVGALVVAGIRFRERPGHQARQYHGNNLLELIWTVVPTLMVISFSVLSFQRLTLVNDVDSGAAMTIKAEGQQWVWNFQYPSETRFQLNDKTYLTQQAELHIPAGQKIKIELSSKDVIHSFYVPKLGGQKDAVPGRATEMWIQADRPGTYAGQCIEFCGAGHADMLITVVAQNPADYDAWLAGALKDANRF